MSTGMTTQDVQPVINGPSPAVLTEPLSVLTKFMNLQDAGKKANPVEELVDLLEAQGFFKNLELWGTAWDEIESLLKKCRDTDLFKYESPILLYLFNRCKEHNAEKGYLEDNPDSDKFDCKADWQIRFILLVLIANLRHPKGLYYDSNFAKNAQTTAFGTTQEFGKWLDQQRDRFEQLFRIYLSKRKSWEASNGRSTKTHKAARARAEIFKANPIKARLEALPTGNNGHGGQLVIVYLKLGRVKPDTVIFNNLENKRVNDFRNKMIKSFGLTQAQQENSIVSIPEDLEDVETRFGKQAADITLDKAGEVCLLNEETWTATVKRAKGRKLPLVGILRIGGESENSPKKPSGGNKRKPSSDATQPNAKKVKNDSGSSDDTADGDDKPEIISAEKDGVKKDEVSGVNLIADDLHNICLIYIARDRRGDDVYARER